MQEELLKEDMIMGLGNYIDIITSGDYGVPKDEKRAREFFEKCLQADQTHVGSNTCALAAVGLGEIYAYGLGVPVDINRAMSYWDQYPDQQTVIENKRNFKKTLFGWKRVQIKSLRIFHVNLLKKREKSVLSESRWNFYLKYPFSKDRDLW